MSRDVLTCLPCLLPVAMLSANLTMQESFPPPAIITQENPLESHTRVVTRALANVWSRQYFVRPLFTSRSRSFGSCGIATLGQLLSDSTMQTPAPRDGQR